MQNRRYPKLFIRSKNDLAKHISHKKFGKADALALINRVLTNFDNYWEDNKEHSKPEKGKYVRSAYGTPLGLLLKKIDAIVLAPHDELLPNFVFGGLKGKNHAQAAKNLLGTKRKRTELKIDLHRFFEQITDRRVAQFFQSKCNCDIRAAKIFSKLCCVAIGPKENGSAIKTIARGFATSPRLSVWCNLDAFIKLNRLVKKRLRGKDPRISIYIDDIGITASRASKREMENLLNEIKILFEADPNQKLQIHELGGDKTKILSHKEGLEFVGLNMFRNKLGIGKKARKKRDSLKSKLQKRLSKIERVDLKKKYGATSRYKRYIESL